MPLPSSASVSEVVRPRSGDGGLKHELSAKDWWALCFGVTYFSRGWIVPFRRTHTLVS